MQETGPTVYSPYPRRLEFLTICWYNYKGSTFSSEKIELVFARSSTLMSCFRTGISGWEPNWSKTYLNHAHETGSWYPSGVLVEYQAIALITVSTPSWRVMRQSGQKLQTHVVYANTSKTVIRPITSILCKTTFLWLYCGRYRYCQPGCAACANVSYVYG